MEITIQLSKLFDRDIVSVSLEVWIRKCSVRKLSSVLFYKHLVGFLQGLRWVFSVHITLKISAKRAGSIP